MEKGKGTHPKEGQEGGLRWGQGARRREGGQLPTTAGSSPTSAPSLLQQEDEQGWPGIICLHYTIPTSSVTSCQKAHQYSPVPRQTHRPPALPPGWPLPPTRLCADPLTGTPLSSTLGALLPPRTSSCALCPAAGFLDVFPGGGDKALGNQPG